MNTSKSKSSVYWYVFITWLALTIFGYFMIRDGGWTTSVRPDSLRQVAEEIPRRVLENADTHKQANKKHAPERPATIIENIAKKSDVKTATPERTRAFAESRDLAELVDELAPAISGKDGEAMGMMARAYEECAYFKIRKDMSERVKRMLEELSDPERLVGASHLAAAEQRCTALASRDDWNIRESSRLFEEAAANGDAYGLAMTLGSDTDSDLSSRILVLRRIVMSRNPEAIGIMAMSLGGSEDFDQSVRGPYAGTVVDVLAWNLVACSLGRDCGQGGALMRTLCLNQGICIAIDYREYLREFGSTPNHFKEAERKEEEILHLIEVEAYDQIFPTWG